MKKLLIIAIGVFAAGAVHAQDVSFGIKAGANMSNIIKTGDDNFETEFKPGFHAGLTMEIGLGNTFSFAPELVFSQKGYKIDNVAGGGTFTQTTNWIDIPILAKIKAGPAFNIFLGPQVSFLTQTKNKFEGVVDFESEFEEDSDTFKKSIAGGVIGAGFDITPRLGINARYAIDFQKTNEDGERQTPVYKNQVVQAGLGFKF